jgi:hypothetical protein
MIVGNSVANWPQYGYSVARLPEADRWEAGGEGLAGVTGSLGPLCFHYPVAWLSSENRLIMSGCQIGEVDRNASLTETWGHNDAMPVEHYPESGGCYAVPYKYKFRAFSIACGMNEGRVVMQSAPSPPCPRSR